MEATQDKVHFSFKLSDLLVQPLAFKAMSFLSDLTDLLAEDIANKDENYQSRISFIWAFQVKEIAILFRDSVVNLLRLEQFVNDGLKTEEELEQYQVELYNIVEAATNEIEDTFIKCNERNLELNTEWQHQFNPAPAIIKQVEILVNQIKTIQRSQHKLDKVNEKFEDFRQSYEDHIEERVERLKTVINAVEKLKNKLDGEPALLDRSDLNRLDNEILSTVQRIEKNSSFAPYEYIILEDTDKLNLAVGTNGGQVAYKTIDILSEVTGWTSFNLAAPLKNIDSKLQAYIGRVMVNLVQLSNKIKAKLESAGEEEVSYSKSNIESPIAKLLVDYNNEIKVSEIDKLETLKGEINESIRGSQLFNDEYNFLPSSAIGQLTGLAEKSELQRRYSPSRIKKLFVNYSQKLFSKYSKNETTTAAGFIRNVLSFDSENDANSLFLRGGFLGSSFSVDRPEIMYRMENHFQLWQQGYGGALLITGKFLTGKSTLLEILPITYPNVPSYHIVPGQKIDVKGHKRTMSDDLLETLKFIIKYKGSEQCMVTIDDFDYYVHHPAQAYDLIYELNRIISRHSKSVYFAVVMHSLLCERFNNYFDLNNVFTENIIADITPVDLIESAVLTRAHAVINNEDGATHSEALASMSRKVARKSKENIGRAMQLWCLHKSDRYDPNLSSTNFKKIVVRHQALLTTFIMYGTLNQPQLMDMFDEIDSIKVKNDLEGMIRINLLVRPKEAGIAINPYLKTYVESYLP